mmetsp:Transcript_23620/g.76815  ORF Transcript_23620/g.76815 Transcript_23620/m.76815 type:complete len:211 (-) Transcript_23620:32-664(-)
MSRRAPEIPTCSRASASTTLAALGAAATPCAERAPTARRVGSGPEADPPVRGKTSCDRGRAVETPSSRPTLSRHPSWDHRRRRKRRGKMSSPNRLTLQASCAAHDPSTRLACSTTAVSRSRMSFSQAVNEMFAAHCSPSSNSAEERCLADAILFQWTATRACAGRRMCFSGLHTRSLPKSFSSRLRGWRPKLWRCCSHRRDPLFDGVLVR